MIVQVTKQLNFANGQGLLDIDWTVAAGSFVAITGASGSGKTTLLRLIMGLTSPQSGKIEVAGQTWLDTNKKINWPPQQRKVGYVFQNYALFPNMTVRQNLMYALEKNQGSTIVEELMETMELESLAQKYPSILSGGQQQRVALARALVRKPEILLLDEPLSALDSEMRNRLQEYLLKIHKQYQLTTLLVSHDISEILRMADQVVLLKAGKISQMGTPTAIFLNQVNSEHFQLTGEVVLIISKEGGAMVHIKISGTIVQISISEEERIGLKVGDKITLAARLFQPTIIR